MIIDAPARADAVQTRHCPDLEAAARQRVFQATIPYFADRFPEQVEHAVLEAYSYMKKIGCNIVR